eukprot:jgi/Hompol1/5296/HPOL_000935-RA
MASVPVPVSEKENTKTEIESVLLDGGVTRIEPSICNNENPKLRQFKVGESVYEYGIFNVSGTMSEEEEEKEQAIFKEYHLQDVMSRLALHSGPFNVLHGPGTMHVHIRGEIVSANGFDTADFVYIEYQLDPGAESEENTSKDPSESKTVKRVCKTTPESKLAGISQVAQNDRFMNAHFSLPFEATLIVKVSFIDMYG